MVSGWIVPTAFGVRFGTVTLKTSATSRTSGSFAVKVTVASPCPFAVNVSVVPLTTAVATPGFEETAS